MTFYLSSFFSSVSLETPSSCCREMYREPRKCLCQYRHKWVSLAHYISQSSTVTYLFLLYFFKQTLVGKKLPNNFFFQRITLILALQKKRFSAPDKIWETSRGEVGRGPGTNISICIPAHLSPTGKGQLTRRAYVSGQSMLFFSSFFMKN